jgi:hypothetical protein
MLGVKANIIPKNIAWIVVIGVPTRSTPRILRSHPQRASWTCTTSIGMSTPPEYYRPRGTVAHVIYHRAMLLIGFAGIGFASHRRRQRFISIDVVPKSDHVGVDAIINRDRL